MTDIFTDIFSQWWIPLKKSKNSSSIMADLEKKHRKIMAQKTRRESVAASFSPAASAKAPKAPMS